MPTAIANQPTFFFCGGPMKTLHQRGPKPRVSERWITAKNLKYPNKFVHSKILNIWKRTVRTKHHSWRF